MGRQLKEVGFFPPSEIAFVIVPSLSSTENILLLQKDGECCTMRSRSQKNVCLCFKDSGKRICFGC